MLPFFSSGLNTFASLYVGTRSIAEGGPAQDAPCPSRARPKPTLPNPFEPDRPTRGAGGGKAEREIRRSQNDQAERSDESRRTEQHSSRRLRRHSETVHGSTIIRTCVNAR